MKRISAQVVAASLVLAVAAAATAGSIEAGDRLEMAAVLSAPITPTRAIQIAEAGGGRAYGYGMEANAHGHWYEVDVLRGGDKLLVKVNSDNGKVIGSTAAHGEDAQGAHALGGGKLTFGEAIAKAERVGKGPALEANAAGHGATAYVEVDVIQDHGRQVAHYHVSDRHGRIDAIQTGVDR